MTTDHVRQGRNNSRAGQDFQRAAATWLRDTHPEYRNAYHVGQFPSSPHLGDLTAVGDRIIECGHVEWDAVARKLRQAEADARARGLDEYHMWKSLRRGPSEPGGIGRSVVVTRAEVFWRMAAELDGRRRDALVMYENGGRP